MIKGRQPSQMFVTEVEKDRYALIKQPMHYVLHNMAVTNYSSIELAV